MGGKTRPPASTREWRTRKSILLLRPLTFRKFLDLQAGLPLLLVQGVARLARASMFERVRAGEAQPCHLLRRIR